MENQIQKVKPNLFQMISAKASKLDLIGAFGTLTLKSIINEQYPSISYLEKAHGKEIVQQTMAIIVADLNQSFGGDLTKEDILEVVEETRSGITRNLSLEDLYLICRQMKVSGTYKLRVPGLLKAINDHLNEKSNAIANENYNKHLATKFKGERSTSQKDNDFEKFRIDYITKNMK